MDGAKLAQGSELANNLLEMGALRTLFVWYWVRNKSAIGCRLLTAIDELGLLPDISIYIYFPIVVVVVVLLSSPYLSIEIDSIPYQTKVFLNEEMAA
jgi:hypothetical protein